MIYTTIKNANGIHIGDVTHHQDQLATLPTSVSLNTRKTKNNTVKMFVPLLLSFLLILSFVKLVLLNFTCA